jgi:hypothetical protein
VATGIAAPFGRESGVLIDFSINAGSSSRVTRGIATKFAVAVRGTDAS